MTLQTGLLAISQMIALAAGQVLWKMGIDRAGGFLMAGESVVTSVFNLVRQPPFLVGSGFYVYAMLAWFYLLARFDLGYIYPIMSLTYVASFIGAWLFLGEALSPQRLLAIGVITVGVVMLTRG
jgi:drug/metabolite transporter (DMT)-like permease